MKISKLFHWLYAILMLLPIMVFIPNAFYYGFNKEAVAQEKTEQVPVYYESNEVNSIEDISIGRVYHYNNNFVHTNVGSENTIGSLDVDIFKLNFNLGSTNVTSAFLYYVPNNTLRLIYRYIPSGGTSNQQITLQIDNMVFDFAFTQYNQTLVEQVLLPYVTECTNFYIKEYQPVTTNMSITDSMSYAWVSVWQNDLFSWTNNTFLKEPFVYITNLFSIPSDNVLINALSYWLDISIIWLIFDVIMYVPLLTHRWLDKGIVE